MDGRGHADADYGIFSSGIPVLPGFHGNGPDSKCVFLSDLPKEAERNLTGSTFSVVRMIYDAMVKPVRKSREKNLPKKFGAAVLTYRIE